MCFRFRHFATLFELFKHLKHKLPLLLLGDARTQEPERREKSRERTEKTLCGWCTSGGGGVGLNRKPSLPSLCPRRLLPPPPPPTHTPPTPPSVPPGWVEELEPGWPVSWNKSISSCRLGPGTLQGAQPERQKRKKASSSTQTHR